LAPQSSLPAQFDWHAGKKKRDATNVNATIERTRSERARSIDPR
jgi:hypothetical protein